MQHEPMAPGPVVVDVAGTVLDGVECARLAHPAVGGVILFARNFESRAQLLALTESIRAARPGPLLIFVDHEGGRVQRFCTDGFTRIPEMAALGDRYLHDPQAAQRLAVDCGWVLAAELRACGVDMSFTPVLDLNWGRSGVIGRRAFSDQSGVVSDLARALIHGLRLAGMSACGKHFPGHGWAEADSHHALPEDERELTALFEHDVRPYVDLADRLLPSVMPAHVVYPAVDHRPAGFSPVWIADILRRRLGYDGLVFSDDLTMEGAVVAGDIHQRAAAAFEAGCDMVLVCNRPDLADELLAGPAGRCRLDAAGLRRWQRLMPSTPALEWNALLADPRFVKARELVHGLLG